MRRYQFEVAKLTFECFLPEEIDIQKFLFSLKPFMRSDFVEEPVFIVTSRHFCPDLIAFEKLEDFTNDMGNVCVYRNDDQFVFSYKYDGSNTVHYMLADHAFTSASLSVDWVDCNASVAFSSMLRTMFAQALLRYDGISMHSSVISKDGLGYLFLGKSGTGKSTHTRLWLQNIQGSTLLNDDNPMCRFIDDELYVFGSPWSGKTPCYKNQFVKVASFVRLEQAPVNEFVQRTGVSAWIEILPSCSVLKESSELYQIFIQTLNRIVAHSVVGHLKCLPNSDAAFLSEMSIRQLLQNN